VCCKEGTGVVSTVWTDFYHQDFPWVSSVLDKLLRMNPHMCCSESLPRSSPRINIKISHNSIISSCIKIFAVTRLYKYKYKFTRYQLIWHIKVHLPSPYNRSFPKPPIYLYQKFEGTKPGKHERKRCFLPAVNLVTLTNFLFLPFLLLSIGLKFDKTQCENSWNLE
jgi:hypothetical protein